MDQGELLNLTGWKRRQNKNKQVPPKEETADHLDGFLKLSCSICSSVAIVLFLQALEFFFEALQLEFPSPLLHLVLDLPVSPGTGWLEGFTEDCVIEMLDLLLQPLIVLLKRQNKLSFLKSASPATSYVVSTAHHSMHCKQA